MVSIMGTIGDQVERSGGGGGVRKETGEYLRATFSIFVLIYVGCTMILKFERNLHSRSMARKGNALNSYFKAKVQAQVTV